jgi:ComF family protein
MSEWYGFLGELWWRIVSPPHCAGCKTFLKKETILCQECIEYVRPIVSIETSITPTKRIKVFALSNYREPLQTLIRAKHWGNRTASRQLADLVWQKGQEHIPFLTFDYFIPVPLHWTRYAYRGFNQAEVIAHSLAKHSNKSVAHLIKRIRKTAFQAQLPTIKRPDNVKDAFALIKGDKDLYAGKHLVLVDDLMTTGSTLHEAAKVLLPLNPSAISVVVVSRVV